MADTLKPTDPDNEDAPFGLNDDGTPLAPYGMRVDGKPRTTNRGRRPGSTNTSSGHAKTTGKRKTSQSEHDQQRKAALLQLSNMFIETPLAAASSSTMLEKRIGEKQADALAGDAIIWNYFAPSLADSAIAYSQQKPGVLSWMDGIEEKAPLLMIGQVLIQLTKAIIGNHTDPNPEVAKAGRRLARLNVAKMAQAINDEAAAMGIPTDDDIASTIRGESNAA